MSMRYVVIGTGEELARFVARTIATEGGYVNAVSVQKLAAVRVPAVRVEAHDGESDAPASVVTFTMRAQLGPDTRDFDGLEAVTRAFVRRTVAQEPVRIGEHVEIDLRQGVLRGVDARPVPLGAREVALVRKLAEARDKAVDRESLFHAVWPGEPFAPNRLHHYVMKLRRRLGTDARALKTVHGIGYCLSERLGSSVLRR